MSRACLRTKLEHAHLLCLSSEALCRCIHKLVLACDPSNSFISRRFRLYVATKICSTALGLGLFCHLELRVIF